MIFVYRYQERFIIYIIWYAFFLKLLILVLIVCKSIYHSLHPSYINYSLYIHVSRSHAVCLCLEYLVSRFIVHLIYSTVKHRAIRITMSISVTIYTYNVTLYAYGYRLKYNLNLIYYATQVCLPSGNIWFKILCNGENVCNLFVYTNYELRGYVKNNHILTYPLKRFISTYYQFHLPTLSELFLKVDISINFVEYCPLFDYFKSPNARAYIIVVAYISYTCISIKIRICGVDKYAFLTYMECVYMLNVHIVAMVLCPGREKKLWFPHQTMCYCVWGCHVCTPCSGESYIYEA